MAAKSNTLANYYIQIMPSTDGITEGLQSLLGDATAGAGESAGKSMGSGLVSSLGATVMKGLAVLGLGKMISDSIKIGSEFQSDFAMLSTIMDQGAVSTDNMKASIAELSNELGISQSSIAQATYSVISATGDTEGALDITRQASKLALAGMTDTNSAVSVLASTMNAYKMSAEDVEHISDSLLMTQNLGVTTVAELSSNMGRAISTASAYGVSLENLEAAYVGTTKGGISTAESTTYISSMLKELGKDGSGVAKIIQSETGKSFAELMKDGESLGDVLGILLEAVDGDTTALMNLWSSAEAGKAANAIINTGLTEFNDNLDAITGSAGSTETAVATMDDTVERKIERMRTSLDNLKIKGFEAMAPVLADFADKLAGVIGNVDAEAVSDALVGTLEIAVPLLEKGAEGVGFLASNLDLIVPIISTILAFDMGTKLLGLVGTVAPLLSGVTQLAPVLTALTGPVGLVIVVVGALGAGIVTLWHTNEDFRKNVTGIWNGLVGVAKTAFDRIQTNIVQPVQNAWKTVTGIADKLKKVFDFKWSLPELKIPKISLDGGQAPYGLGGKGRLPSFDIQWRAEGAIFTRPTILQGVGEAGAEAVLPIEKLNGMFDRQADRITAQNAQLAGGGTYNITMNINGADDPEEWGNKLVETLKRLNRMG